MNTKDYKYHPVDGGMSLRDWLAGQALGGLSVGIEVTTTPEGVATRAYRLADAVLAAREEKP